MKKWIQITSTLLLLIFPLLVYLALKFISLETLSLGLVILYTVRLFLRKNEHTGKKSIRQVPLLIFMLLALLSLLTKDVSYILMQPFALSVILYFIFFLSLIYPPTVVERIYMSRKRKLSSTVKNYCRTMNKVWCLFFCLNAAGAFYTAMYCDITLWAIFNGLVTYLLVGGLFSVEYLIYRERLRKSIPEAESDESRS